MTRILLCIFSFGVFLYSYIDKQNQVTKLRISVPEVALQVKSLKEENTRLQYLIEQFENPAHLMELARGEEYHHLKHPLVKEVLACPQGVAMDDTKRVADISSHIKPKTTFASAQ